MAAKENRIIIRIDVNEKNASVNIDKTKKSVDGLASSTERLAKATNQNRAQSGLNNAILIETGRVASDAAYGMQGIANNLSRLIELGQEYVRTGSGGLRGALSSLGKSLLGTGGILIGIQLLLSYLPRLQKKFSELSNTLGVVASLSKQVGDNAKTLVGNFELYTRTLLDSTETTEQKNIALKKLKEEYPEFNAQILLDKERTEEANIARLDYIDTLEKQAIAQAAISKSQEIYGKIVQIEFERELDLEEAKRKTNEARFIQGTAIMANQKNAKAEAALNETITKNEIKNINDKADSEIAAERKKLDILFKLIDFTDSKRESSSKRNRIFKEGELNYDREIEKLRQKSMDNFIKREETKIAKESTDLMMMFTIRTNDFKRQQKQRLDDYIEQIKEDENFKKKKLEATEKYNESIRLADQELADVIVAIEENAEKKRAAFRLKRAQEIQELSQKMQLIQAEAADAELMLQKKFTDNAIRERMRQLESEVFIQAALVKIHDDGTKEKAEAEIKLAKLQKDLALENVSYQKQRFDQIMEIYNQGASAIGFISEAIKNKEIKDAGDSEEAREKAMKKAWEVEKALKISRVIMDTYQAAWLSYGSQLVIGDPTSPIRAQIAQALTIANGIAQIAAISSTQYNSTSLKSKSSGARTEVEAPDFNVVGASPESQLAQSVAEQQAKPIKAFVVGKDVTTQQELDRNIRTTAGLGG